MANEEHLAKLEEGAEVWNRWREEAKNITPNLKGVKLNMAYLQSADLTGVWLQDSSFISSDLDKADLSFANLERADLSWSSFQGANFIGAQLNYAQLSSAKLQGAKLVMAQMQGSKLVDSQLQNASIIEAQLHNAHLKGAYLEGADLRGAVGLRLDETNIRNIRVDLRFSKFLERHWNPLFIRKPRAIPWIELRRAYTGVNFLLTLVALLAFLFPYVLQAGYLQALNWFQATLVETTPILKESLENANQTTPLVNPAAPLVAYLENLTPCFAQECKSRPIIWLILGGNQSIFLVVFNILLIAYNALRFYVTQTVNILRDEEEQGGWSPKKSEVDRLIPLHITIKCLFFAAVASGLINALVTLFKIVQVPA